MQGYVVMYCVCRYIPRICVLCCVLCCFFQAEDGIRYLVRSRGLGDVYKRQSEDRIDYEIEIDSFNPDLYETICCDKNFDWVVYLSLIHI